MQLPRCTCVSSKPRESIPGPCCASRRRRHVLIKEPLRLRGMHRYLQQQRIRCFPHGVFSHRHAYALRCVLPVDRREQFLHTARAVPSQRQNFCCNAHATPKIFPSLFATLSPSHRTPIEPSYYRSGNLRSQITSHRSRSVKSQLRTPGCKLSAHSNQIPRHYYLHSVNKAL